MATMTYSPQKDRVMRFGAKAAPFSEMADFTTGQVSKVLNVAPRTVSKWCDSGKLRHHRLPGSADRRIARDDLAEFMRANGMGHLLGRIGGGRSVAVGVECAAPDPLPDGWTRRRCDYATGAIAGASDPCVKLLVVHAGVGLSLASALASAVRAARPVDPPAMAVVVGADAHGGAVPEGFDFAFPEPLDGAALWAALKSKAVPS